MRVSRHFPQNAQLSQLAGYSPRDRPSIARAQELVGRGLRVLRVFYSRDLIQMIYELYKTKIATATI